MRTNIRFNGDKTLECLRFRFLTVFFTIKNAAIYKMLKNIICLLRLYLNAMCLNIIPVGTFMIARKIV